MIYADDKLPDDVTLKKDVVLVTYVIKDDGKFYLQIFLEKPLFIKQALHSARSNV